MGKAVVTSIRVDEDVLREAKALGLNVSKVAENALREAVRRLKGEYFKTEPNSPSVNVGECGRRDLNPGHWLGRPENHPEFEFKPFERRIENKREYSWRMGDSEDLLRRFKEFCLVDLQLSKATLYPHLSHLRRFLGWLEKPIEELTVNDIRRFLLQLRDGNPYTYSNMLKALRRFLRDFLGRPELIQGFRFPTRNPGLKRVPNKDELRRFYKAIDDIEERAIFLLLASSGLRRSEALNLKLSDVDFERRMLIPNHDSKTKKSYLTFYNEECEEVLKRWLKIRPKTSNKLFPMRTGKNHSIFVEARKKTGINISPQILREWFACEMGRLGVPDRYVDAFCGRVPRSVLARHYTDFSPEKLKEIYDKAYLKIVG